MICMQLALQLEYNIQTRIAGQPIVTDYLHDRLPYTVQVLGGKFAGDHYIYLLHFERPLCHSQHYLGSTKDLERRLKEHRRKHHSYVYRGKRYRRYHTIQQALAHDYSAQDLAEQQFDLLRQARTDAGVPILMAVNRAGIAWHVAQVWQADRSFEYYLKRRKHASRVCPICQHIDHPF